MSCSKYLIDPYVSYKLIHLYALFDTLSFVKSADLNSLLVLMTLPSLAKLLFRLSKSVLYIMVLRLIHPILQFISAHTITTSITNPPDQSLASEPLHDLSMSISCRSPISWHFQSSIWPGSTSRWPI